jgi:hypothetical protein
MQVISRFRRGFAVLALGVFLFGSTAGTAAASSEPQNSAACPQSGQRAKTSSSARVYLVDPEGFLRWIPGTVYTNLWDNWNNIGVYDNLFTECFAAVSNLDNARLTKSTLSSNVYIWDSSMPSSGAFRWIAGQEIFNKYGFSWSKIGTQSSVTPIAAQWPWDN